MDTPLVSTWSSKVTRLPPKYVFPPHRRPNNRGVETSTRIPIIELDEEETYDRPNLVKKIVQAAEEFGVFEVVDHGVPRRLLDETRAVTKEFFSLPDSEKYAYYSRDLSNKFIVYTSSIEYEREALHYWRDAARHSCPASGEDFVRHWPLKPIRYREVVRRYVDAQRTLGSRILKLLSEGLGLEPTYFESNKLVQEPVFTVNHYPVCPEPSLTWGAAEHYDPGLMTILLQDHVPGLQVFHKQKWVPVHPMPYSFVINVGNLLEIVTNGKLKSVRHRVLTNATTARTTAAFFMEPSRDTIVQPAAPLIGSDNPPNYREFQFGDILTAVRDAFMGEIDCPMEAYMNLLKL